jgi:hypothetical protein
VVRHVDAIGKTDKSLIAITMTGRITNAPSTSGLKDAPPPLHDSKLHRGPWNKSLIPSLTTRQKVCHGVAAS